MPSVYQQDPIAPEAPWASGHFFSCVFLKYKTLRSNSASKPITVLYLYGGTPPWNDSDKSPVECFLVDCFHRDLVCSLFKESLQKTHPLLWLFFDLPELSFFRRGVSIEGWPPPPFFSDPTCSRFPPPLQFFPPLSGYAPGNTPPHPSNVF